MSTTLLHYAELIVGLIGLSLALAVFRPMKRYYANHSTIARNDEFLVVLWLILLIFSITIILYALA